MAIATRSGTTRVDAFVTTCPSMATRPWTISARASERLASPSFDSARSSETVALAVVAKLEGDSEVLRAQRLHGVLQGVLRCRRDAHLFALDRGLGLEFQLLQVLDD